MYGRFPVRDYVSARSGKCEDRNLSGVVFSNGSTHWANFIDTLSSPSLAGHAQTASPSFQDGNPPPCLCFLYKPQALGQKTHSSPASLSHSIRYPLCLGCSGCSGCSTSTLTFCSHVPRAQGTHCLECVLRSEDKFGCHSSGVIPWSF